MAKLRIIVVLASCLLCGCVFNSSDSSQSTKWRFRVVADNPEQYLVRVPKGSDYRVNADGTVEVLVARTIHRWEYNFFGEMPVIGNETTDEPYIYLVKNGRIVQRISTPNMHKLLMDGRGYVLLKP